ncbi:hypothetical protein [Agathobaculum sp. Marseille-P7918]|uniref:hypothetical protein n=1 Tax=Agathobaculum sp. Marseille-P7918 TaxID=2479843 RepID=UPI000F62DEE2|nr:hypothetical protein [Agathobaculum sp. Marseille-P7918]
MAQGVNGLRQFADRCDAEVKRKRADQRALHERLGARMQTEVHGKIAGMMNNAHGGRDKVASWQKTYIGSGGGYAAVRPVSPPTGKGSPGAITNAIVSGHAIRRPSGRAKRGYKPDIHVLRVNGINFYDAVRSELPDMLQAEVERWGDEMAARLEGR